MKFSEAIQRWGTPDFDTRLCHALESLDAANLPLQQGLTRGSYVLDQPHRVRFISQREEGGTIHAVLGIFYQSVIAGCNCADDPTPLDAENEYCEVLVSIDKATAAATVRLFERESD